MINLNSSQLLTLNSQLSSIPSASYPNHIKLRPLHTALPFGIGMKKGGFFMGETILCVGAAMVGAGFASGREIMRFFSRYGDFSWVLVLLAAAVTAWMIRRMLGPTGVQSGAGKGLLCVFSLAVGGGMTAAAGELWALTVPVRHARTLGSVATLMACLGLAGGSLRGMAWLGRMLLPFLLAALVLCLRLPGASPRKDVSMGETLLAVIPMVGYCGLNGMTAAGVLGGESLRQRRNGISLAVGLLTALLLGLGNAALLPHAAALRDAPLPTVTLLRAYGKTGHYLSAAVLYLAASSTLIAVLRELLKLSAPYLSKQKRPLAGLCVLAVSLLGFDDIVGKAYPVLGWAWLFLLFIRKRSKAAGHIGSEQKQPGGA